MIHFCRERLAQDAVDEFLTALGSTEGDPNRVRRRARPGGRSLYVRAEVRLSVFVE